MVGTHFPDDRDVLESALQRMREAFEALRDGRMTPSRADEEFLAGYDTVRDLVGTFFLKPPENGVRPVDKFRIFAKDKLVVSFVKNPNALAPGELER